MPTSIELALGRFFDPPTRTTTIQCPQGSETYIVNDAFGENPYWSGDVRSARFEGTLRRGILYRPQIVNDIIVTIEKNLNGVVRGGLVIKGPQGIGKSHSLVNTVLKLQSTGKHLVTFIPDCAITGFARLVW